MRNTQIATGLAATAIVITGCSSSDMANPPAPSAMAPTVTAPQVLAFDQDTSSSAQVLRLADGDTAISQLELGVMSSDETLLPLRGIVIEGNGAERQLRITPAPERTGTATLILTARDPGGLVGAATISVRVNAVLVAFSNLTRDAFATQDGGDAGRVSGVTVLGDVDEDPAAFDTLLQAGVQ